MRAFVLGLLAGMAWVQQQAVLPAGLFVAAAFLLAAVCLGALRWRDGHRVATILLLVLAGTAAGAGWATHRAALRLSDALAPALEGQDLVVTGVVAGLPQRLERGVRFPFDVEQSAPGVPQRISLAWYQGRGEEESSLQVPVRAGERWRFVVRLKRPHGNLNPQGVDFEAWLFERDLRATGYVRPQPAGKATGRGVEAGLEKRDEKVSGNLAGAFADAQVHGPPQRLDALVMRPGYLVERLRERIRDRFERLLPTEIAPYGGILTALAIGDQQAVDGELWAVFARTGITHLMSISGLHITMFGGLAYAIAAWFWRRSRTLPLRLATPRAAAVAGFLAAAAYSALAGFAVPAQRTLFMLGAVSLALLAGRELAASRVLVLALLLVLVIDPWAVLAAGFWLSFGAVAVLFLAGSGRLVPAGWLREGMRTQWAVTLASLPALLALFQQFSLVSPVANALAIPLIGLAVTPLALLGALPGGDFALQAGHALVTLLMRAMDAMAAWPWAVWQQASPPGWSVAVALAGALWMLLPQGFPARWLGFACFLPLLTVTPPRPVPGTAEVTVLDVGQGLAVHVQTAGSDLLFDAGPAYSAEADSGSRLIVPYLRAAGVHRLETLVISHRDRDHEGGARSVLAVVPVDRLLSSLPFEHALSAMPVRHETCVAGMSWERDGVRFEVLHPPSGADSPRSNALSCVLRVEAGGQRLLLTGDIEAPEEAVLAGPGAGAADLAADLVVVSHHGSRGASSPAFVAATGAHAALFAAGYRNRFGHPHPEVIARWQASGATIHRTDLDGALRLTLGSGNRAGKVPPDIRHEREERRRYWHHR